jgi:hypothetical protein
MHRPALSRAAFVLRGAAYRFRVTGILSWDHNIYQVFMFATDHDAEIFRAAFEGARMHPSEKGTGKHWSAAEDPSYVFAIGHQSPAVKVVLFTICSYWQGMWPHPVSSHSEMRFK